MFKTICLIREQTIDGEPAQAAAADIARRAGADVQVTELACIDGPANGSQTVSRELLGRVDPPGDVIAALAELQPDVVVTSEQGVARIRDRLFGSPARRLARNAPCPVVFVRRHSDLARGPVLLLTGHREPDPDELGLAKDLSALLGTEMLISGYSHTQAITVAARYSIGVIVVARDQLSHVDALAEGVGCPVAVAPKAMSAPNLE